MRLDDGNAELKRTLVLDAWSTTRVACYLCTRGRSGRGGTDKMCSINLNLVAPFRFHFPQCRLGVLKQNRILNVSKADRDTRGVCHRVCTHAKDIGGERSRGRTKDKLERVLQVDFKPGHFS